MEENLSAIVCAYLLIFRNEKCDLFQLSETENVRGIWSSEKKIGIRKNKSHLEKWEEHGHRRRYLYPDNAENHNTNFKFFQWRDIMVEKQGFELLQDASFGYNFYECDENKS